MNEEINVYDEDMNKDQISSWIRKLIQNYKAPVGVVKELTRNLYFTGKCSPNDSNYCFIAFSKPQENIDVVSQAAARFTKDPIEFYWVNTDKYPDFADTFGSRFVIYRAKRKKYVKVDCQDLGCIVDTCNSVISGSASFVKLDAKPELVERKRDL